MLKPARSRLETRRSRLVISITIDPGIWGEIQQLRAKLIRSSGRSITTSWLVQELLRQALLNQSCLDAVAALVQ